MTQVTALNVLPFLVALSVDHRPTRSALPTPCTFPSVHCRPCAPCAAQVDHDRSHYHAGFFGVIGARLAGRWLQVFLTVGSIVSLFGLYRESPLKTSRLNLASV